MTLNELTGLSTGFKLERILRKSVAGTLFSSLGLFDRCSKDEIIQLGKIYDGGIPLDEFNVDIFRSEKLSDSHIEKLVILYRYGVIIKSRDDIIKYIRFFDKFDGLDGLELSDVTFLRLIYLGYPLVDEDIERFSMLGGKCKNIMRKSIEKADSLHGFHKSVADLYWGMKNYCKSNEPEISTNSGNIGVLKKKIIDFSRDVFDEVDESSSEDVLDGFNKEFIDLQISSFNEVLENLVSQIGLLKECASKLNLDFNSLGINCNTIQSKLDESSDCIVDYYETVNRVASFLGDASFCRETLGNLVLKICLLKEDASKVDVSFYSLLINCSEIRALLKELHDFIDDYFEKMYLLSGLLGDVSLFSENSVGVLQGEEDSKIELSQVNTNFRSLRKEGLKTQKILKNIFNHIVDYDKKIHELENLLMSADDYVIKYDGLKKENEIMTQENSDFSIIKYFYDRFSNQKKYGLKNPKYCGSIVNNEIRYFFEPTLNNGGVGE